MKKIIITTLIIWGFTTINAQETTSIVPVLVLENSPFTLSGFLEIYYCYDFGVPENHTRPSFFYNYNRSNELNLNLGFVKANYTKANVRANLALMAGTYAQYNMASEPPLLQNVFEANVGVKVSKDYNLWVDAGILPSHIGFESAIGVANKTLTRSILAENSPYYEAGVKIGYTSKSEKWFMSALYLNGWQRIQKIEGNQTPAFGTQLSYTSSSKKTFLNWSTYIGNEQPDSDKKWRYFNNFFGQLLLTEKTNVTVGFDIGAQQATTGSDVYDVWFTPIVIVQYNPTSKIQLAARGEYYQDPEGVIINTGTPNGFKTYGLSANFDYLPFKNVMFRLEARTLSSTDAIFLNSNGHPTDQNQFVTTLLAVSF
jgi:hypothetical protein